MLTFAQRTTTNNKHSNDEACTHTQNNVKLNGKPHNELKQASTLLRTKDTRKKEAVASLVVVESHGGRHRTFGKM